MTFPDNVDGVTEQLTQEEIEAALTQEAKVRFLNALYHDVDFEELTSEQQSAVKAKSNEVQKALELLEGYLRKIEQDRDTITQDEQDKLRTALAVFEIDSIFRFEKVIKDKEVLDALSFKAIESLAQNPGMTQFANSLDEEGVKQFLFASVFLSEVAKGLKAGTSDAIKFFQENGKNIAGLFAALSSLSLIPGANAKEAGNITAPPPVTTHFSPAPQVTEAAVSLFEKCVSGMNQTCSAMFALSQDVAGCLGNMTGICKESFLAGVTEQPRAPENFTQCVNGILESCSKICCSGGDVLTRLSDGVNESSFIQKCRQNAEKSCASLLRGGVDVFNATLANATNNVTGGNSTIGDNSEQEGLSRDAKVAIVLPCVLVGIAATVFGVYQLYKKGLPCGSVRRVQEPDRVRVDHRSPV